MKRTFTLLALLIVSTLGYTQQSILNPAPKLKHQRLNFELKQIENSILLYDLTLGESYRLNISSNTSSPLGIALTESSKKTNPILIFEAKSTCTEIFITFKEASKKKKDLTLSISRLNAKEKNNDQEKALGSITTTQDNDVEHLIQDVFIGGDCFDVAGSFFSGSNPQVGTFDDGDSSINIEKGVIISTGNISNAHGPNNAADITSGYASAGFDADLDAISNGGALFDIAKIEFDFTPTEDQITFEYAFASDEYCEWAGTQFNDVFGFFISGPGINGPYSNNGENIAIIPTTGENVAINSINHFSNTGFYVDNSVFEGCASGNPFAQNDIEFDGFTVVLTAIANVIPCETYHIKLIIADRGDDIYDSAVFLKANSFGGAIEAFVSTEVVGHSGGELGGYEGCSDALITFTRFSDDLSDDLIIGYSLGAGSTATPGVDYSPLPPQIIIPAGQSSVTISIEIYNDLILEGIETILVDLEKSCSCSDSDIIIEILEPDPVEANLDNLEICRNEFTPLTPTVTGGIPPYTYLWEDGSTSETFNTSLSHATTFSVTVSDDCSSAEAFSFLVVPTFPTAELSGGGSICQGADLPYIDLYLDGNGPWFVTYSVNGTLFNIENINYSPYPIFVDDPGSYSLISVTNADGCPGDVFGESIFEEVLVSVVPTITPISCFGMDDGAVQLEVSGGTGPYTYNWNNDLPNESMFEDLSPNTYDVTVTDTEGCEGIIVANIEEPDELLAEVTDIINIDCVTPTGSISLEASGGDAPYSFEWGDGIDTSMQNNLAAGTYNIIVTDDSDCQVALEATIDASEDIPDAIVNVDGPLNCYSSTSMISALGSSTEDVNYQWLAPDESILPETGTDISVTTAGIYTLIVTNESNFCTASTTTEVLEDTIYPLAEANGENTLNCSLAETILDGEGSSTGAHFNYEWSTSNGNILTGSEGLYPTVDAPGTYSLQVLNTENGCSTSDQVQIYQNIDAPNISLQTPETINCIVTDVALTSTGSDIGEEFDYEWSTLDGVITGETDTTFINTSDAGTYTLEVTNSINGCVHTMDVLVPIDVDVPFSDAGEDIELDCDGTAIQLEGDAPIGANYTYQWTTLDGALLNGDQSLSPSTSASGTYSLLVTNTANGCFSTDESIVINNTGALTVEANVQDILNCNNDTVQISSSLLEANSNFTALWSSVESNPIGNPEDLNAQVNIPGTYSIQITNLENGCISLASVDVEQDLAIPIAEAGEDQVVNCYDASTLLDAIGSDAGDEFSISWTNPDGSTPANASEQQLQTTLSGTFLFTVLNTENGCQNTDEVTVNADFLFPTVDAGEDMTLNCAVNSIALNGSADANAHGYELEWLDHQNDSVLSTSLEDNIVNTSGLYTLSILDTENGCLSQDTIEVFLDIEIPIANAIVDDILNCNNEMVNLSSTNSSQGVLIQYEWSDILQNEVISTNTTVETSAPGNYQLIVSNIENFCVDTSLVEVTQDIEIPIATIEPVDVLNCVDLTVPLDASASSIGTEFLYQWTLPNGDQLPQSDTPSTTAETEGFYQLIVLNSQNGCTEQTNVTVQSIADFPNVEAGPTQLINCYQPQVDLNPSGSATGGTFTYEWYQGGTQLTQTSTPEILSVETAGEYQLIITNTINNCRSVDSVHVNINIEDPIASAGLEAILNCEQTSLNLDGSQSSADMNYEWSTTNGGVINGADSPTPLISEPGIYSLLVTNIENGCFDVDQVVISIDTLHPQIQIQSPAVLTCEVTDITLNANSDGNYNYAWTNEAQDIISQSTSISVENPGNYQFIAINSVNECKSVIAVEVEQNIISPTASAGGDGTLTCDFTTLELNGSESSENSTYDWSTDGGTIQSGGTSLSPIISDPGEYTIHVVDNFNGCEAWSSVIINEDIEQPLAIAATDGILTCTNTSIELIGESNSNLPLEYEWLTATGETINTDQLHASITQPGNYNFYVNNPANGCNNSFEIIVAQDIEAPTVEAGEAGDLTCFTTELTLNGSVTSPSGNNYQYQWSGPNGGVISNINTLNPVVQLAGEYTLVVTNPENGCFGKDSVPVKLIDPTGFDYDIQQPLCHKEPAHLDIQTVEGGAEPFIYSIDAGSSFGQNSNFTLQHPGTYFVVVQDANGCEFTQGVTMVDIPKIEIIIDPLATIQLGESYQIQTAISLLDHEIKTIAWTPAEELSCADCLEPLATPFQTTDYTLQVTNTNGCVAEAALKLIVDRRPNIYIPNAFSPNGDGINDIFYIFAKENSIKTINVLQIYSRWGETLFEVYNFQPNDPNYGWDGFYRSQSMNPGVFTYWTEIEMVDGETIILKGDVTIVK